MSSQAKVTSGMLLLYNGTVYAELTDISAPAFSVERVDATSHDSTNKVSVPGQSAYGDLTFKGYFVNDTAQAALRVLALAKTVGTWRIVYPSAFGTLGYIIPGFVTSLKHTTPMKGAPATMEVTISPTESVTEITTAGAGLTDPYFSSLDNDSNALAPSPAAAGTTYVYDLPLYADDTSYTITPVATAGTIYVDGTIVATTVASSAIAATVAAYPVGSTKTTFIVVDEAAATKVPKIYRLRYTRNTTNHP